MDLEVFIAIGIHGIFWLAAAAGLVYVIANRIQEKKEESFEHRDN